MIDRRTFLAALTGGLLAAPVAAEAQQAGKIPRLCFLELSAGLSGSVYSPFFQGLRDLGYVDGQTITIDYLSADGRAERFPALAAECLRRKADIIVPTTTLAAQAAKNATRTTPIVMNALGDPVASGLVVSLARPGGNVTGVSMMSPGLAAKRLELLKEAVPRLSRTLVLSDLGDSIAAPQLKELERAAHSLGVTLLVRDIRSADDLPAAFDAGAKEHTEGLLTTAKTRLSVYRNRVLELAARHRLPGMYPYRGWVDAGGLMAFISYTPNLQARTAYYVDKILKGAKPGDLPVEQPTKFELVINLTTGPRPPDPAVTPAAGGSGDRVMDRRSFISALTAGLLTAPLAAEAQDAGKVYRVGYIGPRSVATIISDPAQPFNSFRREMRQRGYVEGQNLVLELRTVEGRLERLSEVVGELVRLNADVIVAVSGPVIQAAQQVTRTIPIVMVGVGDPVATGLVASLARPGGNVTGLSQLSPELSGKRLDLLKAVVPGVSRVAIIWNPTNPTNAPQLRETKVAAQALGVQLQLVEVRGPQDFESTFQAATRERAGALITLDDLLIFTHRIQIVALAAKSRLPAIYGWSAFAEAGGLMSYGPDFLDMYRQAAVFVDKILKGAKPGDLPIQRPTKFELVINLKTAKALGLTIPQSLLQRADQVIE